MEQISPTPTLYAVTEKDKKPIAKLELIQNLLDIFHKKDILYCHWKSNEHLGASMSGDTDLDILIDVQQKAIVCELFRELGFKKFEAIPEKRYKDIHDFLGLDLQSGKIIHLHVHFRLTMGEPNLKGYQLGIEANILESRVFDKEHDVYRSSPAYELILLFIRQSLKLRYRDKLKLGLGKGIHYPANILKEFHWLKQRCTNHDIEIALTKVVKNHQSVCHLFTGEFNKKQIFSLSGLVKKEFINYRLYSPLGALAIRWLRELSLWYSTCRVRYSTRPVVIKRVHPQQGLVVAVIGADGSGKSTIISCLETTFSKKLDVYRIYFGKGIAGRMSWPRKMLIRFKKKAVQRKPPISEEKVISKDVRPVESFRQKLFKCIEAIIVAFEKRSKFRKMHTAKSKGMLVICDRFPQSQIAGLNDGPALQNLLFDKNIFFRWISQIETGMYKKFDKYIPDIVFKLVADARIIHARKQVTVPLELLEAKIKGIKELKFPENCQQYTVDASQPLESILLNVKQAIWKIYP